MKTPLLIFAGLLSVLSSCCFSVKEQYLGNHLYLSEYDTIDRRILYSKQSCSGSGIEIVPMTVLEYAYDSKWIIAKSGDGQTNSKIQFWIIKNDYEAEPTVEVVKSNVLGPLDFESFSHELVSRKIELNLKKID